MLKFTFAEFSISHIKRGRNTIAHLLARFDPFHWVEHVFVDDAPSSILTMAEIDIA